MQLNNRIVRWKESRGSAAEKQGLRRDSEKLCQEYTESLILAQDERWRRA
jgi:hypothetical protein